MSNEPLTEEMGCGLAMLSVIVGLCAFGLGLLTDGSILRSLGAGIVVATIGFICLFYYAANGVPK